MNALSEISKRLSSVKLFLIAGLSVLAVYQTSQLWFVNITNRNFFLQTFNNIFNKETEPAIAKGYSVLITPYRILSGTGDGRFAAAYSGLADSADKAYADSVLTELFERGTFSGTEEVNLPEILSGPSYIYDYSFPMPASIFADAFGKPRAFFAESGVTEFNRIIVQPPTIGDENARVYFLNGESFARYDLSANGEEESAPLSRLIAPPSIDKAYYVLENGAFEAVLNDSSPESVTVTNPYAGEYGDKLLNNIRPGVERLFDNPAMIVETIGADGTLTFVDSNTVVLYTSRDVLEYSSYRINENAGTDFASDLAAALSFVDADTYVMNEFYLAGYSEDNGRHTFRFNYVINDFPLIMPPGWLAESDNGSAIEVTAERGYVVGYKKLAYNFHIAGGGELKSQPDYPALTLGYLITEDDMLDLGWY